MITLAQESYHRNLIDFYLERAASPSGVIVIMLGLVLMSLVIGIDRIKWGIIALAMIVTIHSYNRSLSHFSDQGVLLALPEPFRTVASLSQPLAFGTLLLLSVAAVKPVPWQRQRTFHPALIWLLMVQLLISVRQMSGGFAERAVTGLIVYPGVMLTLGLGLSRWLYDETHIRSLARAMSWAGFVCCMCTLAVLVLDRDAAYSGNRLVGISENPQRTAAMLALCSTFAVSLAWDKDNTRSSRRFHLIAAITMAGFLFFTGSRTGALAMIVGVSVYFRRRLGAASLAAATLVGFFLLVLSVYEKDLSGATDTLLRTQDTRSAEWMAAWRLFMESPLFGTASDQAAVESSYLSVAAQGGIIALVPMVIMLFLLGRTAYRLHKIPHSAPLGTASNLALAGLAQFFLIWTFESYMIGLVTSTVYAFYATIAISVYVEERLDSNINSPVENEPDYVHEPLLNSLESA